MQSRGKLFKALGIGALVGSFLLTMTGCDFRHGARQSQPAGEVTYYDDGAAMAPTMGPGNASVVRTNNYILEKQVSGSCAVGQTFEYYYTLVARSDLEEVTLKDYVPEGAELISSSPEATVDSNKKDFGWTVDRMYCGEVRNFSAIFKALEPGDKCSSAVVFAIPVAATCVCVGEPVLDITKCGPECVCFVGEEVTFNVWVTNKGNFPACDVVVVDKVPEGLVHSSGQTELSIPLGTLMPGETKELCLQFCVSERGEHCNVAEVHSSNAGSKKSEEACVKVCSPEVSLEKHGPTTLDLGTDAKYEVVVSNTGDVAMTGFTVTDYIPEGMVLVSAPGGTYERGMVTWYIDHLDAGQTRTFNITLCAECPGTYCNDAVLCGECNGIQMSENARVVTTIDEPACNMCE